MKKIKLFLLALLFVTKSLSGQNYDIVIKGGHLIDPANNLDQPLDLAIMGNRIVAVEKTISSKQAKKIIDASGLIVSPGLIDMHTHNFYGTVHNRYLAIALLRFHLMDSLFDPALPLLWTRVAQGGGILSFTNHK